MSTIKVIAGDIEHGAWQFTGLLGSVMMSKSSTKTHPFKGESIDLKAQIKDIEALTEDKVKKLAGTAGWAIAGGLALGPLGAIGGMLLGGNKKEVAFACYLTNGKKFMATTSAD